MLRVPMVSSTQQTEKIRQRKHRAAGTRRKRTARAHGTPPFPIQPAGYDPTAADARPAPKATESAQEKK